MTTDPARLAEVVRRASPGLGDTRLVTIDGPSGAGKTRLAEDLRRELALPSRPRSAHTPDGLRVAVIALDDLYEGWHGLVPSLWERIERSILAPIRHGGSARFQRYDWIDGGFGAEVELCAPDVLILEGVGSGHPVTRPFADPALWLDANPTTALARAKQRDGFRFDAELDEWFAHQQEYLRRFRPQEHADLSVPAPD